MTLENVLSGDAGGTHPPSRRWVWTGAALAVASLVLAACASPAEQPDQAVLVGGTPQTEPPLPAGGDVQIDPMPSDGETPSGAEPWDDAATEACAAAVGAGFDQVAQSADDLGVTSFWSRGGRWVVCDVADGGEPVLLESSPGRPALDEAALAVATTEVGGALRVVAGGRLPWPVEELSYTFPDGHTEQASFVTGQGQTWWSVVYTATDGVLVDAEPGAPEPVTISVVGAAAEAFRVAWAELQRSE